MDINQVLLIWIAGHGALVAVLVARRVLRMFGGF